MDSGGSKGLIGAIQEASIGQILVWILLIVAIVWGFVATTAMVVAMLIALAICAICITVMIGFIRPMMPKRDKSSD